MPTIAEILARELDKPLAHVQNVIDLLDQGNTIPFIARYRKELHGMVELLFTKPSDIMFFKCKEESFPGK